MNFFNYHLQKREWRSWFLRVKSQFTQNSIYSPDLEYLIAALRTQVSQYSDLYSKMHQLLTPFAIYCCQNSEKDRPEIDRLISDFKGSLTKILAAEKQPSAE